MIHSSLYSFGKSPVWDTKTIKEHLCIPEDQLKFLSNIPGWNKEKDSSNVSRIEKDTIIENSQSSQKEKTFVTFQSIRKEQNIKNFDEHFKNHESILLSIATYRKKIARSLSLFDIDKVIQDVSDDKPFLKRVLSASHLSESQNNSCTTSLHKGSKSVVSYVEEPKQNNFIVEKKKNNCPKVISEDMEVIPPLPVNVSLVENEKQIEVLTNSMVSTIHTKDGLISLKNTSFPADTNNCLPTLLEKKCQLDKSQESESSKNVTNPCIVKDLLYVDKHSVAAENNKINEIALEVLESVKVDGINNKEENSNLQNACREILECNKELHLKSGNITVNTSSLEKVAEKESHKKVDDTVVNLATVPITISKIILDIHSEIMECDKELHVNISSLEKAVAETELHKKIDNTFDNLTTASKTTAAKELDKKSPSKVMECDKEPFVQSGDITNNTVSLEKAASEIKSHSHTKNEDTVCNIATAEKVVIEKNFNEKSVNIVTTQKTIVEKESGKKSDNTVASIATTEKVIVTASDLEKNADRKSRGIAGTSVKTVTGKRKLQFKEKTNKKHKSISEKQVECGPRHIKRAAEIYYSDDNFRSMINIMKHFL